MRDVFVFLEIFSREGGIQSYVKDILNAYSQLAQRERTAGKDLVADVFLLRDDRTCQNPFDTGDSGLKFHYLKTLPPWLGRWRLASTLALHLMLQRPRQVFCGHVNLAPLVRLLCQRLNVPYTVMTYGKEVWDAVESPYQTALREARRIWTISRYSRDRASEANHLDPDKFQMVPCMVDGSRFVPGEKPKDLLDRYQLHDAKVLMTVARLWSGDIYKGVDVTIRALPQIAEVFPEVKYLVIGRGDDQPRLAQLAQDLNVADRVVFAGFVATEALPAHYHVADAYVMPSQEGFGIVYLEAMACGVPVISGDADGSADPVQDGKLGWRVPHRDPDAVAAACLELLKGNDPRCDGTWLRSQALELFGKDSFTQRLHQLLSVSE